MSSSPLSSPLSSADSEPQADRSKQRRTGSLKIGNSTGLDPAESDVSDLTPLSSPVQTSPARKNGDASTSSSSQQAMQFSGKPRSHFGAEGWNVKGLGPFVWVLIDSHARVFRPEDSDIVDYRFQERIWWPGKLESLHVSETSLKVRLFGASVFNGTSSIEIHQPCPTNVLSLQDSWGRVRFRTPTFVNPESPERKSIHSSPRKRPKGNKANLKQAWYVAFAELQEERKGLDEEESDGMPEIGSAGFSLFMTNGNSSPSRSMKGAKLSPKERGKKRNRSDSLGSESEPGTLGSRWVPPTADELLQIPGELVLALEKSSSKLYWPAKVMGYVPPRSSKQEPKYQVRFLDDAVLNITRNMFVTSYQSDFSTCTLGKWESQYREVQNDEDDDSDAHSIKISHGRSSSPQAIDPPPNAIVFTQLSIREQFVYTKPVLLAILNGSYPPALPRHDGFLAGGSKRKSAVDEAGLRGRMDPRDVATLQHYLSDWCLRDEKRAQVILDELSPDGDFAAQPVANSDIPSIALSSQDTVPHNDRSTPDADTTPPLSDGDLPPSSSRSLSQLSLASTMGASSRMNMLSFDGPKDSYQAPSLPPRQRGCDAYESLSGVEKADYCLNVLLPEAILQILLWRTGRRCHGKIMSDIEEKALHEEGKVLLKERDWVYDVLRLREASIRGLRGANGATRADVTTLLSNTGRPRRNVGVPRSYLE